MTLPRAVFLGSSNCVVGTWPETLSERQGWLCHNYSISGGAFTQSGSGRFSAQAGVAVADMSYDHSDVQFLFIGDLGNDVRATASITTEAISVITTLKASFPNARIIIIPALWGWTPRNMNPSVVVSLTNRAQEAREVALALGAEVIEYSWTWHFDSDAWMKPVTPTESGLHYVPSGYFRIVLFVEKFLRGESTDSPIGWKYMFAVNSQYVQPEYAWLRSRRDHNDSVLQGKFTLTNQCGQGTHLGWLAKGTTPLENVRVQAITDNGYTGWLEITNLGQVKAYSALSAGVWNVNAGYPTF